MLQYLFLCPTNIDEHLFFARLNFQFCFCQMYAFELQEHAARKENNCVAMTLLDFHCSAQAHTQQQLCGFNKMVKMFLIYCIQK